MRLDKCMKNACLTLISECVKICERGMSVFFQSFAGWYGGYVKSLQTIVQIEYNGMDTLSN